VVLLDAPAVLGKSRWAVSPVARAASEVLAKLPLGDDPIARGAGAPHGDRRADGGRRGAGGE
jgi:hypothetical protein